MSYDAKIDSAQMASDLTSIADAIRAKSGGGSQLVFPTGFVSEVGTITNLVKKSVVFTLSSSGRTYEFNNPNGTAIPKVIIVTADMNDFSASPTSGTIYSGGVTLNGPASSSDSYYFYNNNESYYNSSGNVAFTYSYDGNYRNRIARDGTKIIVGVRSMTGSRFEARVTYTVDLYYW